MKKTFTLAMILASQLSFAAQPANAPAAQESTTPLASKIDMSKLYVGMGFNHNRIDSSTLGGGQDGKTGGVQFFAGYQLKSRNGFDLAAEAGVIQTGNFYSGTNIDADGIWAAGVVKKNLPEINDKLAAIVRLGLGLQGDDGLLMGFGAQYRLHPQAFMRLEYLNKDLSQSYQLNAVYQF